MNQVRPPHGHSDASHVTPKDKAQHSICVTGNSCQFALTPELLNPDSLIAPSGQAARFAPKTAGPSRTTQERSALPRRCHYLCFVMISWSRMNKAQGARRAARRPSS